MDFNGLKDWVFMGLFSGAIYILWSLKGSVDLLNEKVAVIIERTTNHEKRIERLEDKI
jgi:hypothetical protein